MTDDERWVMNQMRRTMNDLAAENKRLREAGDVLYDAVLGAYQAGYLEEAGEAMDGWDKERQFDGPACNHDWYVSGGERLCYHCDITTQSDGTDRG
jgi:hypothetical protein